MSKNPLSLKGIEFIEFSVRDPKHLDQLWNEMGFTKTARHPEISVDLYQQNDIHLLVNSAPDTFGARFQSLHGPSISAMGWRFENPEEALREAVDRGARRCEQGDYLDSQGARVPAIFGIGESLIYFVRSMSDLHLQSLSAVKPNPSKGFLAIDHLTNNVFKGTMQKWASFYKEIFGFEEVRYFDIK